MGWVAGVGLRDGWGATVGRLRLSRLWGWALRDALGRALLWWPLCPGRCGARWKGLPVWHALCNRSLRVCRLTIGPLLWLPWHPRSRGRARPACRQRCTHISSRRNLLLCCRRRLLLLLWRGVPLRHVRLLCPWLSHVCNTRLSGMLSILTLLLLLVMCVVLLLLLQCVKLLLLLLCQMELLLSGCS